MRETSREFSRACERSRRAVHARAESVRARFSRQAGRHCLVPSWAASQGGQGQEFLGARACNIVRVWHTSRRSRRSPSGNRRQEFSRGRLPGLARTLPRRRPARSIPRRAGYPRGIVAIPRLFRDRRLEIAVSYH